MNKPRLLQEVLPPMNDSSGATKLQIMSQGISPPANLHPEAISLIRRYNQPTALLEAFSPHFQVTYTRDTRRAYLGKAPALGTVTQAYGFGAAKSWAAIQLWDLAEFSGCKTKLTEPQIDELAQIICIEYGYMKLTELMDFFRRFKVGQYGKFYGAVDPIVITCALGEFAKDRIATLRRLEREEKEREQLNSPDNIRFINDCRERKRMNEFYSFNFRSRDFTLDEFAEVWWLFKLGYERSDHGYDE